MEVTTCPSRWTYHQAGVQIAAGTGLPQQQRQHLHLLAARAELAHEAVSQTEIVAAVLGSPEAPAELSKTFMNNLTVKSNLCNMLIAGRPGRSWGVAQVSASDTH